ncbi:hypothetical protein [uncultured Muribaculum sp.]|uniref:hypothetical protein n=1 Tax=uncultured Muribaculum sp. TaxID=1918613 RepID=UPI0025B6E5E9|nr:hypothetical protein [uncultured Muribaculum sp.]
MALSAMAAVALVGCGASKNTTESTHYERDDTTEVYTVDTAARGTVEQLSGVSYYAITAQPIAEDVAVVDIPVEAVAELSDGASYTASEGRATAQLTRVGDNIKVEARCDSVARLCEIYRCIALDYMATNDSLRKEITKITSKQQQLQEALKEQKKTPPNHALGWMLGSLAILCVCLLIIVLKPFKRNKNE